MKIKNKSRKRNPRTIALIVIGIAVLLVVGAFFTYKFIAAQNNAAQTKPADPNTKVNSVNYSAPTTDQIQNGAAIKSANNSSDSSKTPTNDVVITSDQQDTNGVFHIRSYIDSLASNLTCSLSMTNGTKTITKSAAVQASASVSACEGFDVSTSDGLSAGTWNFTVTYSGATVSGSATQSVEIHG